MDSNDIINLGTNNYNVHNELQDLISKTANLDSNS